MVNLQVLSNIHRPTTLSINNANQCVDILNTVTHLVRVDSDSPLAVVPHRNMYSSSIPAAADVPDPLPVCDAECASVQCGDVLQCGRIMDVQVFTSPLSHQQQVGIDAHLVGAT